MPTARVPRTLLIVDDDEALSQLLAWEFQDLGYVVCRAADCDQALAAARVTSFEFALVDFHLPDGDGRSLSQRLKQQLPRMQIVMISADRAGATAGGTDVALMVAFVEKPVPTARIHHILNVFSDPMRWTPFCTD
jgi:DNA-binding response OmpR family regulator